MCFPTSRVPELLNGLQGGFARQLQLEINKHIKRTTGARVVLGVRGKKQTEDGEGQEMDTVWMWLWFDAFKGGGGRGKGCVCVCTVRVI